VPRPKKEPEEKVKAETESSMKIKRTDLAKTPEPSAKSSLPKAEKFLPPKKSGSNIVKDSDNYFNRTIFINSLQVDEKLLKIIPKRPSSIAVIPIFTIN
jgi:hypothetical protein